MGIKYTLPDKILDLIRSEDALFHYTRKETAIEFILNQGELKLSEFRNSNDPQEYKYALPSFSGFVDKREYRKKISKIVDKIDEIKPSINFLSFCKNEYPDSTSVNEGCQKSRMWSQYGGGHTGICLVLSKKKILQIVEKYRKKKYDIHLGNISYGDLKDSFKTWHINLIKEEFETKSVKKISLKNIAENIEEKFFTKQEDYKDENEFRIVYIPKNPKQKPPVLKLKDCIIAVVLGDKFPKVYYPTIRELTKKLNTNFRHLYWEGSFFALGKFE